MAPIRLFSLDFTKRSDGVSGCPPQTSECNSPLPGAPPGPSASKPNLTAAHIVFSVVVIVVVFLILGIWILVRRHGKRPVVPCGSRGKRSAKANAKEEPTQHPMSSLPHPSSDYALPPGLDTTEVPMDAHLDNKWRPVEEFNTFDHDPSSPLQIHVLRESSQSRDFPSPQEEREEPKRHSSSLLRTSTTSPSSSPP